MTLLARMLTPPFPPCTRCGAASAIGPFSLLPPGKNPLEAKVALDLLTLSPMPMEQIRSYLEPRLGNELVCTRLDTCEWRISPQDYEAQAIYDRLNREVFDGRLPHYRVSLLGADALPEGHFGVTHHRYLGVGAPVVHVLATTEAAHGPTDLSRQHFFLHEMCHVAIHYRDWTVKDILGQDPFDFQERHNLLDAALNNLDPSVQSISGIAASGLEHLTKAFQDELARLASRRQRWAAEELATFQAQSRDWALMLRRSRRPLDSFCGDLHTQAEGITEELFQLAARGDKRAERLLLARAIEMQQALDDELEARACEGDASAARRLEERKAEYRRWLETLYRLAWRRTALNRRLPTTPPSAP